MAEDIHRFRTKLERSTALRYALAPVCIAVALLLHLSVIGPFLHPTGLFLAAIVAAAWFGGAGPGFLAALLATFVLPQLIAMSYPLIADFFDLPRFLAFGMTGVAVGWGTTFRRRAEAALRRSELELRKARNELEMKVLEQTAELRRSEALLAEAQKLSQTGSFGWKVSTGETPLVRGNVSNLWIRPNDEADPRAYSPTGSSRRRGPGETDNRARAAGGQRFRL